MVKLGINLDAEWPEASGSYIQYHSHHHVLTDLYNFGICIYIQLSIGDLELSLSKPGFPYDQEENR